jgi:TetR/AcrR family transcriptional regulator, transcriptional repressor for nem operon
VDTRERLIEGTRELLRDRGYVGTSPKAIQQRSGAGQGSMYHHFTGKRDLALAAIEREAAGLVAAAEADLAEPGTPLERVTRYLRRGRDALRGCPVGHLTMDPDVMADPGLRQPVADSLAVVTARLAEVLAQGRASGELDVDPVTTATALVAALQGGYVLARASGDPATFTQAVDGAIALLTRHSPAGEE